MSTSHSDAPRRRRSATVSTDDEFTAPTPATGSRPSPKAASSPANDHSTAAETEGKQPTRKTSYILPLELVGRMNALVANARVHENPPGCQSTTAVVERAIRTEVERLENEYHKGKPWPLTAKDKHALKTANSR